MNEDIDALLSEHGGTVALVVTDFSGEVLYERLPDHVFHSASLIKVPLLVEALRQVDAGRLDLAARVTMRAEDRVPGSGVLHELGAGLQPTLLDLLTLMIVVSDNTATNLVIEAVGQDALNTFLREGSFRDSELVGLLQLPDERKNERQKRGERNRTSARDMARMLRLLANGELLSPAATDLALDILTRQQLRDIVGRRVPRGADGELLYRVASKSGELFGVHHDAGLVWTPRPLVVAVLSSGGRDPREHPDNRDVATLAALTGRLIAVLGDIPPAHRGLDWVS